MGYKIEQTVYEVLPTGDYPASIGRIELEDGQYGQQLKFSFDLLVEEYADRTLLGWASAKFSTKSKLYGWTRAALGGQPIDPAYVLDTDDLIGKKVLLTVLVKQKDDGSGIEFNKIDSVRPYRNGQAPVQQPEPVADAAGFGNF